MAKGYGKRRIPGKKRIDLNSIKAMYGLGALLSAKYDEGTMNEFIDDLATVGVFPGVKSLNSFDLKIFKGQLVLNGGYDFYVNNIDELKNEKKNMTGMDGKISKMIKDSLNIERKVR